VLQSTAPSGRLKEMAPRRRARPDHLRIRSMTDTPLD